MNNCNESLWILFCFSVILRTFTIIFVHAGIRVGTRVTAHQQGEEAEVSRERGSGGRRQERRREKEKGRGRKREDILWRRALIYERATSNSRRGEGDTTAIKLGGGEV